MTNLPLVIPLSICLPKSCGDGAVFLKLLATLQYKGNKILDFLKTIVDFDHTRDSIPAGLDQDLMRQLAAVANHNTDFHLTAAVPS